MRINGAPASVNSLCEWLSVLWLTPAMDRLFTGSAGDRRRFLDRLVLALEPGHAHHSARYEAAMRARNKLLADERRPTRPGSPRSRRRWPSMARRSPSARARTVAALDERLGHAPEDEFARAAIALDGWDAGDLAAALRASRAPRRRRRPRDRRARTARTSPSRHRAKAMPAAQSSTGEQKALLLGLVLAHAELVAERRGAPPILLLDEVAAHLDPRRRAALFARLEGRGQVWMTATEAGAVRRHRARPRASTSRPANPLSERRR